MRCIEINEPWNTIITKDLLMYSIYIRYLKLAAQGLSKLITDYDLTNLLLCTHMFGQADGFLLFLT